jgi:hypothetical protein
MLTTARALTILAVVVTRLKSWRMASPIRLATVWKRFITEAYLPDTRAPTLTLVCRSALPFPAKSYANEPQYMLKEKASDEDYIYKYIIHANKNQYITLVFPFSRSR